MLYRKILDVIEGKGYDVFLCRFHVSYTPEAFGFAIGILERKFKRHDSSR